MQSRIALKSLGNQAPTKRFQESQQLTKKQQPTKQQQGNQQPKKPKMKCKKVQNKVDHPASETNMDQGGEDLLFEFEPDYDDETSDEDYASPVKKRKSKKRKITQ